MGKEILNNTREMANRWIRWDPSEKATNRTNTKEMRGYLGDHLHKTIPRSLNAQTMPPDGSQAQEVSVWWSRAPKRQGGFD